MSMPLDVGIEHVSMLLSFSERSDPALGLIDELAQRYGLTIYDPQGDDVTRPGDVRNPLDPALVEFDEVAEIVQRIVQPSGSALRAGTYAALGRAS